MSRVGFEPTTAVFERAKTVQAVDHATTVIGLCYKCPQKMYVGLHEVFISFVRFNQNWYKLKNFSKSPQYQVARRQFKGSRVSTYGQTEGQTRES
jgi:hypothetical protein